MGYVRKSMQMIAVLLVLTGMPAAAQEEAGENLADLFYRYTKDNVVCEYTDPDTFLPSHQREQKSYDGFLALEQIDMDWDGGQELLAIRAKTLEKDGYKTDSIVAEVYRRQDNTLKRAAQYTLAEGTLAYVTAKIDVFLIHGNTGPVLCCEARGVDFLIADGMGWTFRAVCFDGSDFQETAAHSLYGSSFEDVDFSGITATMYSLGLSPSDPTEQMMTEQNDWVDMLCTVRRSITAEESAVNDFLFNPAASLQYGETVFLNCVNTEMENKLPGVFVTHLDSAKDADSGQENVSDGGYSYSGDFIFADSDSRYLTYEDLAPLTAEELLLARNEIYARRGYIFQNEELNAYFSAKSWYEPSVEGDDFTEEYASLVFNSYEIANIGAILAFENENGQNPEG